MLLCLPAGLPAGEVLESTVAHEGNRYTLSLRVRIAAPRADVHRVITDYRNLAAINPDIEESLLLGISPDGEATVRTVINVCILVFCKRVKQLQRVRETGAHRIEAVIIPQGSDFSAGDTRWELSAPTAASTELLFTQSFEPDFWVPPVIGPWLIRSKLESEVMETARYIETLQAAP